MLLNIFYFKIMFYYCGAIIELIIPKSNHLKYMRKLFLSFTFTFLLVNLFSQSLEEQLVLAIEASEKGDVAKAISIYDELLKEYPDAPMLYVLKGETHANIKGEFSIDMVAYRKAMVSFDKALELDSTFFPAHQSRGGVNIYFQNYPEALKSMNKAVQYSGNKEDFFHAISDRGAINTYLNKLDDAIADYRKALETNPNAASVYSNLAMLYRRKKDNKAARGYLEKALELSPNESMFKNNLALILMDEEEYAQAEVIFTEMIELNPESAVELNNRGHARTLQGKYDLAKADIDKSIELYPENSYAFKNRGILYLKLEETEKACADWAKAEELGFSKTYGMEVLELIGKNCKD